tara:strand:- start:344 stop:1150 length:807 start_codon:yes stop_codon:yes gene_type:complete
MRVTSTLAFKSEQLGVQKFPICVSVLAFEGVRTLNQTLHTNTILFKLVKETHVLFQQIDDPRRRAWAENLSSKYSLISHFQDKNIGQRLAFAELVSFCTQPFILVLEEDFKAAADAHFAEQLQLGIHFLKSGTSAFRLRSRKFPGEPNYIHESWLRSGGAHGGRIPATHLIEYVTWDDAPEEYIKELNVCYRHPKTWCTSSKHAQYTNNPTLYSTDFLRWLVSQVPADADLPFEGWLTRFWAQQSFTVAYSDGLFTHERLDRTLGEMR